MMPLSLSRYRTMKSMAVHVRETLAARALPEPLRAKLVAELRAAVRGGFHVDLEQLDLALAATPQRR